jgi:ubiquinone/menaquinone biosynthesis C-methylase UbiE
MTAIAGNPIPQVAPFDSVAAVYDSHFTNSLIGTAQRQSVWKVMDQVFLPGQRILEINCGTGVDAFHLASRGVRVMACDASEGMISVARQRRKSSRHRDFVDLKTLAIEQISQLEGSGPYDGVLSNFAGLNCLRDLKGLAGDLARLVRPGGMAVLCLFGGCCLWEILWYAAQRDFARAFRRFNTEGVLAIVAPERKVLVRYPSVNALRCEFSPHFHWRRWRGVGVAVPPSYLEFLAVRFSRVFRCAAEIDPFLGQLPGIRALADHVVITLERKSPAL